jgi:hypothetical protein
MGRKIDVPAVLKNANMIAAVKKLISGPVKITSAFLQKAPCVLCDESVPLRRPVIVDLKISSSQ